MLIHSFSKCTAGFTNILFVAILARNEVYDITELTGNIFGKSLS